MNESGDTLGKGRILAIADTPAAIGLLTEIRLGEDDEVRSAIGGDVIVKER